MDRRRETRSGTQENVRVKVGSRVTRCRMRNLSRSGCMVEGGALLLEVGAPVEIVLGPDAVAQGQVAWQLGENFGVQFRIPVPADLVREYAVEGWSMGQILPNSSGNGKRK